MRRILLTAMVLGTMHGAQAADLPFLRGGYTDGLSTPTVNWSGVYVGGQGAYGGSQMDFTNSGQDLLAKLLNNVDVEQQFNISQWPLLGKQSVHGSGFGGFVGYNFQWDDTVVGIEMNYVHGTFAGSSGGTEARVFSFPTDYQTSVVASATSSMTIKDYGSLRVRGAYAFDNFLPYLFAGVALGQADIDRVASYNIFYHYVGTQVPPLPNIGPASDSLSDNANGHLLFGYSAGLGIDIMLVSNLFLRAEFEYLRFTAPVDANVATARLGLGYKF